MFSNDFIRCMPCHFFSVFVGKYNSANSKYLAISLHSKFWYWILLKVHEDFEFKISEPGELNISSSSGGLVRRVQLSFSSNWRKIVELESSSTCLVQHWLLRWTYVLVPWYRKCSRRFGFCVLADLAKSSKIGGKYTDHLVLCKWSVYTTQQKWLFETTKVWKGKIINWVFSIRQIHACMHNARNRNV